VRSREGFERSNDGGNCAKRKARGEKGLFMISRRGFFAEWRTRPLLDESNAIVRIPGKGVSTTRRRMAEATPA